MSLNRRSLVKTFSLMMVSLSLGACSTGLQRKDDTAVSAASLRESLAVLRTKVAQATLSMNELETVSAQKGDMKAAFKKYSDAFADMSGQGKKVQQQTAQLKDRMATYLAAWQVQAKEITNPEIQKVAEDRRIRAAERQEAVQKEATRIREQYKKLTDDMGGIRVAVENDLTPAGVASLAGVMGSIRKDSSSVQSGIETITDLLTKLEESLAGGTAGSGTTGAGQLPMK